MKKAFTVIGCLLLSSVFMFGCGSGGLFGCGGTSTPAITSAKPWTNSNDYEYVAYEVDRFAANNTASNTTAFDDDDIEARGEYSTTLITVRGNIYESDQLEAIGRASEYFAENLAPLGAHRLSTAAGSYTVLYTSYRLEYLNGKTDEIGSVALFKSSSLMPVFSYKTVRYESSGLEYTATADYVNRKNVFESNEAGYEKVETELKNEEIAYDNETLYYVLRAHSSLAAGGSSSVNMRNSVYTGIKGSEDYRAMAFQVASSVGEVGGINADKTPGGFIDRYFDDGEVDYYDSDVPNESNPEVNDHFKGYAFPALLVGLQYSNANSGTVKYLYYSQTGFDYVGETTSKVLLQTLDFETDKDGNVASVTRARIKDYKTSPLM